jgi:hypothetical protein
MAVSFQNSIALPHVGSHIDAVTTVAAVNMNGLSRWYENFPDYYDLYNTQYTSANLQRLYLSAQVNFVYRADFEQSNGVCELSWPGLIDVQRAAIQRVAAYTLPTFAEFNWFQRLTSKLAMLDDPALYESTLFWLAKKFDIPPDHITDIVNDAVLLRYHWAGKLKEAICGRSSVRAADLLIAKLLTLDNLDYSDD